VDILGLLKWQELLNGMDPSALKSHLDKLMLETSTLTFTSTITFGLPFMVLDLVYKFKMIGIRELVT
jgi:hypothetical protein